MASLLSFGKRLVDQINPLDNGRTFQNPQGNAPAQQRAGVAPPSLLHQATHNGLTNTVGNLVTKPVVNTVTLPVNIGRAEIANITNNKAALDHARQLEAQSIPGFVVNQAKNYGKAFGNLPGAIAGEATNNPVATQHSTQAGLTAFNRTTLGQALSPVQNTINAKIPGAAQLSAQAGYNTKATGAQKYFADPLMGTIGTIGLAKGGEVAGKNVAKVVSDHPLNEVGAVGKDVRPAKPATKVLPKNPESAAPQSVPKTIDGLAALSPYTRAPKAPNAFQRSWQTVSGVISQHGTGGRELANRISQARNQSEIGQQGFLDKIPTVQGLKKGDFETFVQALEQRSKGEKINVAPHIQQAIAEWNKAIPQIRQRATSAGLSVGDLGPNYFPRQYKDLYNNKGMGKLAEQMVNEGKAKDLGDAIGKLQFMRNEYQKPFGNLEKTRQFDLGGYEHTHEALANYISRSFDRITKAEQLGSKNEILHQLQARAQQEGYDVSPGSTFDKHVKIALGDTDKGTVGQKVSGAIRNVNAIRSLSTAQISNATQLPINTGTIAGLGRTLKGAVKIAVSPAARDYARKSGVALDHSISNLSEQGLGVKGITRNIASPFFKQVEKFNRVATAVVGKDYGNHLARKGDTAQLREKFGVTGDIGKTLTREQEVQVSRKLVELAQFKVDPQDLPAWVDSPTGKLIAQFRTFGYKQTGFVYNQVLREAVKGNFLPLTRFVAAGVPLGAANLALKGAIKGSQYTQPGESNGSKAVKSLAAVGGFGLPGSEGQNLYKSSQYGNTIGGIAGTVGGPTLSAIAETSTNVDKGIQRKNWTALEKQGVRNIPVVGPSIANRAFPAKQVAQANPNGTPAQKKQAGTQELKKLKSNPPQGYTMQQTSDGKWAYTLDNGVVKQTDTKAQAQKLIRDNAFGKEGRSYKVIGNTVIRRGLDGKISETPKIVFDYQVGSATLTSQRNNGDLGGWLKTANSQLDNINKQLQDPSIDPLEALKLQNQADSILNQRDKYVSYGGFTKPKTGRSGGSSASTSGYKTASSGKISPPKGVSVRKLAAPQFKTSGVKKISVSKIPTNYLNKKIA